MSGRILAGEEVDSMSSRWEPLFCQQWELMEELLEGELHDRSAFRKAFNWKNQKIQSSKNKDMKSTIVHPHCSNSSLSLTSVFFFFLQAHIQTCFFLKLKMRCCYTHQFLIFVNISKTPLKHHFDKHTSIYHINTSYILTFTSIAYFWSSRCGLAG